MLKLANIRLEIIICFTHGSVVKRHSGLRGPCIFIYWLPHEFLLIWVNRCLSLTLGGDTSPLPIVLNLKLLMLWFSLFDFYGDFYGDYYSDYMTQLLSKLFGSVDLMLICSYSGVMPTKAGYDAFVTAPRLITLFLFRISVVEFFSFCSFYFYYGDTGIVLWT